MAVGVQKYIKNMAKSVAYTTSDVLSTKFEYVKDFKDENQEVFKEVYHSIKDYRTTYARVKKTLSNNKVMDAARVGYDSVLYSITTGDFYAKQKETEVIEKYGGSLMQGFDIDDDDFNWDNDDMSTGDKVVATAIKKNSKIGTAMTVEAIAQTGKAQMDVSKENTMLLYTQNERMLNKLDSGFTNIMGFLKQTGEQNAKVQNQMNENLNKFMQNVDNNVAKLTKQMDELLEMQRNMYKPVKQEEKKKTGYNDIISRNGVINIKEYANLVKKQAFNTLNDNMGGMLSQLFGDTMGEGSNMLAQFAASPFRMVMEVAVNKALGKGFDKAAGELNKTLEGIIPSLMGRLNAASKKDDSGVLGFLGKIFGVKDGSKESVDTSKYNKGAIPFDGITKRAITDVIPYYLRQMTAVLTGNQEMVYDYQTGKWTSMKSVLSSHHNTVNSANIAAAGTIKGVIEKGLGRSLNDTYTNKSDYDRMNKAIESLAAKIQSNEGSLYGLDLDTYEKEAMSMLKHAMRLDNGNGKDRRVYNSAGKKVSNTGLERSFISQLASTLRSQRESQNSAIKSINENDSILRIIEAEGLASTNIKSYQGKGHAGIGSNGDYNQRAIQEMPFSQSLLRAKDEYGFTLYQYLRDMTTSLRFIKATSVHTINGSTEELDTETIKKILGEGEVKLNNQKEEKYMEEYYSHVKSKSNSEEVEKWKQHISNLKTRAEEKGKSFTTADTSDFIGEDGKTGTRNIMAGNEADLETKAMLEARKALEEKDKKRWKAVEGFLGKDEATRLKGIADKFDPEKSFDENMKNVKDAKFTDKFFMFSQVLTSKINNPVKAASDALLKVDYWLQNLIYGDELSESEKKKSLFDRMKDEFHGAMNKIKDSIDKGMDWLREKMDPILSPIKNFFLGEADDDGIRKGGLFGNFIGGAQKALRKNAAEVKDYVKQQALAAKNKLKSTFGNEDETTTTTTSNDTQTTSTEPDFASIYNFDSVEELDKKINEIESSATDNETFLKTRPDIKYLKSIRDSVKQKQLDSLMNRITSLEVSGRNADMLRREYDRIRALATGGVNRTGKPFLSVLSAGEKLNGQTVTGMGVYKINPGDVVVNPAPPSIRSKQAIAEKNYLSNIRRNADTDDGLSPTNTDANSSEKAQKVDPRTFKLLTETDYRTLDTKEKKAEYIGNVVGKGLLGGGLGLLVGGPLIGASIGAASALSNSTSSFANFLFGSTGDEVKVDENGKIIRNDDGLISKEILDAVPDIKKFGLGGAVAGLLTPIGPLGGVLAGAALGFAKKSELFQGSLFGDEGVFSDENMSKLKKGAKNMGIGAIIGAFTGPFGLVGNALIGATAGYVTSTDKFKDAILGEKENPDDPKSKRKGGMLGVLKDAMNPLKNFGKNLVNNIMDEIFGKDEGEGRKGGIFGAINDNVVKPVIEGGKSVFQELTNKAGDLANLLGNAYKKFKAKAAGNVFLGGLFEFADKVSGKAIKGVGSVAKAATKPFRLLGDDGLGGALKKKRIKKGEEHDMTARERLAFRGKHGMSETDDYSASDEAMARLSKEELEYARDLLEYNQDENYYQKQKNNSYDVFGQSLRESVTRKQSEKIIKFLKAGNYKGAEKYIRTLKVPDDVKASLMTQLNSQKSKLAKIDTQFDRIKSEGKNVQSVLSSMGINVDVTDSNVARYLDKQLVREIAHKDAGLTDEEVEWEKERDFWTNDKSPLTKVNTATNEIATTLEKIYNNLTWGREYDKMSDEKKAEYGSREAYINSKKQSAVEGVKKNLGPYNVDGKLGELSAETMREAKFGANQIINDWLPFYTGNLKEAMSRDDKLQYLKDELDEIINRACEIFDTMVKAELIKEDAIKSDLTEATLILKSKNPNMSDAVAKEIAAKQLIRRNIIVVDGDYTYSIPKISYSIDNNTLKIALTNDEINTYNEVKKTYIDRYIKSHTPQSVEESYMDMQSMIKNALNVSAVFTSSTKIPTMLMDAISLRPKEVVSKAFKGIKKTASNIFMKFGSHGIDEGSLTQKLLNDKYAKEAEREWEKAVKDYNDANSIVRNGSTKKANEAIEFLDKLTESIDGLPSKIFGTLSEEDKKKVKEKFVSMYIQAKKDKQVFGRGLLGSTGKLLNNIAEGVKSKVNFVRNFNKIIFGANGDAKDAKNRFMAKKRKEAEQKWNEMMADPTGNLYMTVIQPILAKWFENTPFDQLDDDRKAELKEKFIYVYCDDAYNKLLYGGNTIFDTLKIKATSKVLGLIEKPLASLNNFKQKIKNNFEQNRADKLADKYLSGKRSAEYLPKYNAIAQKLFKEDYDKLDDDSKKAVNLEFYKQYKADGGLIGAIGRGINTKIVNGKRLFDRTTGTLKSGVRNAVQGKLDRVKEYKERQQEQDTLLGKFFDKLDSWQMKREKEKITGKKDSKFAKILKWLFVGGIAAPIIVGFIKDKVMPAIHDKIQPWLKKAGQKLIGKKNEQTGEYEGGLVSGIVNPIKNFFKDKFQTVHDWFHNTGKFTSPKSGFKGLINNLKGVGLYMIDLWKSGASTIINTFIPSIVKSLVVNAVPILKSVGKGLISGIWELISNKNKNNGVQALDTVNPDIAGGGTEGTSFTTNKYGFNNTVGGDISVDPPSMDSIKIYTGSIVDSKVTTTTNSDGTYTDTDEQGRTVSTEKIDRNDVVASGVNDAGIPIFYKRTDTNRTNPLYLRSDGQYVSAINLQNVYNNNLKDGEGFKQQLDLVNNGGAYEDNYNVIDKSTKTGRLAKRTFLGIFDRRGARNLEASRKVLDAFGDGVRKLGNAGKITDKLFKGAGNVIGFSGKMSSAANKGLTGVFNDIDKRLGRGHFSQEYLRLGRGHFSQEYLKKASTIAADKIDDATNKIFERALEHGIPESEATKLSNSFRKEYRDNIRNALKNGGNIDDVIREIDDASEKVLKANAKPKKSLVTKIGDKLANTGFGEKVKGLKDKGVTLKNRAADAITNVKTNAVNTVKNKVDDVIKKAATTETGTKISGGITKLTKAITGIFDNVAKKFAEFMTKHPKITDFVINPIKKICSKLSKKSGGKVAKKSLSEACEAAMKRIGEKLAKKAAASGTSKVARGAINQVLSILNTVPLVDIVSAAVTIVFAIADFFTGWNNAGNILHVPNNRLSTCEKFAAALIRMVPNLLCSLPEPAGAICTALFIIVDEETIADIFIDGIGELCRLAFGANPFQDTVDKREEGQKLVEELNAEHNTNLSFEQWNNRTNATWYTKMLNGAGNALGKITGKSDQVEDDLQAASYKIKVKNDKVQDIKDMLIEIMSRVWGHWGSEYKSSFGVGQDAFMDTTTKIIDKITILLNDLDDDKLSKVEDSADKYNNVANFWWNAKDAYKDGYDDAINYLELPDGTKVTKLIKTVAGLASLIVKSCGGAGLKPKILSIVTSLYGDLFRSAEDTYMEAIINDKNKNITDVNEEYTSAGGVDNTLFNQPQAPTTEAGGVTEGATYGPTLPSDIVTNANANNKLSKLPPSMFNLDMSGIMAKLDPLGQATSAKDIITNTINKALSVISGGGFAGIGEIINSLRKKNVATNRKIDELRLLPTDDDYWKIEVDSKHPFASALFRFTESIARVVKAPFSLSASMNASTAQVVASSGNETIKSSGSSSSSNTNSGSNSSQENKSSSGGNIFTKAWNSVKKFGSNLLGFFTGKGTGRGKGDSDSSDPFHIYQRDFKDSYSVTGDSEHQSVADSGCGPASAASVLRMYGKEGSMNNAVKYALHNKYKERDGGTYPQYFQDYLGANGIATNSNASNEDVINSLAQNKPVILMGQNTSGSKKTPYGNKYSHYVVARGFDKNGNVIVEDSEDRRGSTRYSLADTLRNTSVRITTGRGAGDMSINDRYVTNVNSAISATVSSIIASALAGANLGGSSGNSSSGSTDSSGTTTGTTSFSIDSEETIICGDSITYGLSTTSLGKRALGLGSGTTDKNNTTNAGSYETIFKDNSDVIKKAKNAIFFWGMNEVNTGQSPEDYFKQYQDSIDTILGYAGKSTSDTNVCIMSVIWVPENSGYGGSYNAEKVKAFNEKYIKAFAKEKGYPYIDIFEDSKEVPHSAGDVHPSNYEKLYEIIKKHTGGGSGRGKSIIEGSKKSTKYGRGIWGRDGEEETTTSTTSTDTTSTEATTSDAESTEETTEATTSSSSSSGSSDAKGLISLLGKYTKGLTKGIFGNFYDALYGSEVTEGSSSGSVGTGDAAKMLGKSLTLSRDNGKGSITITLKITEDEVELYDMLTSECGLNAAVACGIIGNWEEENGINSIKKTACRGIITYGGGIMQWTDSGAGNPHLNWIKSHPEYASDPWSWEANKAHAKDTLIQGAGNFNNCVNADPSLSSKGFKAAASYEEFKQLTSAEDAAVNYERAFEVSFNWNGRTSENAVLPANKYYDNNRALMGKILYEMIVNGKCDGGSGRGKKNEKFEFMPREGNPKLRYKKFKSGRGIWGRDGEEIVGPPPKDEAIKAATIGPPTKDEFMSTINNNKTDTTATETTDAVEEDKPEDETDSKTGTTKGSAKSLINKLGKYAKAGIKGVYGKFYDALYGSEVEETSDDGDGNGGYTEGSGVIYAAAMVFEAMGRANPTFGYCFCCDHLFDLECRDGKKIDKVRPDCSGMMSAVVQYMGYYTYPGSAYTDTFYGLGYSVGGFERYGICDREGNRSPDWEILPFDPNDRRPGDMLITNSGGHIDMYVFKDANGNARGFNAGSGSNLCGKGDSVGDGIKNSYEFAKYYLEHNNQLPPNDGSIGAWTIQDGGASKIVRYVGKGSSGSGRGKGNEINPKTTYKANTKSKLPKTKYLDVANSIQQNQDKIGMNSNTIAMHSGRGLLKSLDTANSYSAKALFDGTKKRSGANITTVSSMNRSNTSSYSGTNGNATVDLNQLIGLISVIANNADKMDAVLQLLGNIAVNTENTTTAISNKNKPNASKNGLSALRNALDSSNSGMDIANAVYQIAKR